MKKNITVTPFLFNSIIDADKTYKIIENTAITGTIPRLVVRASSPIFTTDKKTLLYVVGNIGNYRNRIINALKLNGLVATIVSKEEALEAESKQDIFV